MFTLNIRNIVRVGRGEMKWNTNALSNNPSLPIDQETDPKKILDTLKTDSKLDISYSSLNPQQKAEILKGLKRLHELNSGDPFKGLDSSNPQVKQLQEIYTNQKAAIIASTREGLDAVIKIDSRKKQGNDFAKLVSSKLPAGIKSQFETIAYYQNNNNEAPATSQNTESRFGDVSVPNLINHLLNNIPYVADGSFGFMGFGSEPYTVKQFAEFYKNNKGTLDPILIQAQSMYTAGQSLESPVEGSNSFSTKESIITHLSTVSNKETFGNGSRDSQTKILVETALSGASDPEFIKILNKALKLSGSSITLDSINSFQPLIQSNPSIKYAIITGINRASQMPGGVAQLRTATSGISENERKMLENLDTNKTKLLDGLQEGFQKQLEAQMKDMTPVQKNDAEKAIKKYIEDLKQPNSIGWNMIAKNLGAVITNRGSGIGAGATLDLPKNFLADNVSFGFGLSTGKPGVGVGITFDKSITPETKILYGWAGSAFVGMTSQFERWHFTAIAGVGGGIVNISRDMGNLDTETTRLNTLGQSKQLLEQIQLFARSSNNQSKDIEFQLTDTSLPITSTDPTELTQAMASALHSEISKEVRARLSITTFDTETNPVIRSQMIYNALTQTIQNRVNALQMDAATAGFSLKSLGLTLGSFSGVPFILPNIAFSRTEHNRTLRVTPGTTRETVRPVENSINPDILFDKSKIVFNSDGTYNIPLASNSPLKENNTTFTEGVGAKWSQDGKIIQGLDGYGINVSKRDNHYYISYSDKLVKNELGIHGQDTTFDSLERIDSIEKALKNKPMRRALSHLWNNTSRTNKVNDFSQTLQTFQKGEALIEDAKNKFLTLIKDLPQFKSLYKVISGITDKKNLQSALFDIRGAMMMDENQANKFNDTGIDENQKQTKTRFDKMIGSNKMKPLLAKMGVVATDYDALFIGKSGKLSLGDVEKNTIGAVASLKTTTPDMALMPAGTMRFAKIGNEQLVIDAPTGAGKGKMYDTLLPVGSISEIALRTNIAKVLDNTSNRPINSSDLKTLMVDGAATINGKVVKMTDTKFMLCAYADCTNPGIALQPGKVSVDGKSQVEISAVSITPDRQTEGGPNATVENRTTETRLDLAAGSIRKPSPSNTPNTPNPDSTPKEDKIPTATSNPGQTIVQSASLPTPTQVASAGQVSTAVPSSSGAAGPRTK